MITCGVSNVEMKTILAIFALAFTALAVDVKLAWDANDPAEEVIAYRLYQATNITGLWVVVQVVTTNAATVSLPAPGRYFWYVTASNFWTESGPSNIAVYEYVPPSRIANVGTLNVGSATWK